MTTDELKDMIWELLAVDADENLVSNVIEDNYGLLLTLSSGECFRITIQTN